jgi:hypothetical protein
MKDPIGEWVDVITVSRCGLPHLSAQDGQWICTSKDGAKGTASTPRGAYHDWLAVARSAVKLRLKRLAEIPPLKDWGPERVYPSFGRDNALLLRLEAALRKNSKE